MDLIPLVRISIFLALSILLHVVSLAVEFNWLSQPPVLPGQVSIGFVTRSADAFGPAAVRKSVGEKKSRQPEKQRLKSVTKMPLQSAVQKTESVADIAPGIRSEKVQSLPDPPLSMATTAPEEKPLRATSKEQLSQLPEPSLEKEVAPQKQMTRAAMAAGDESENTLTRGAAQIAAIGQSMKGDSKKAESSNSSMDSHSPSSAGDRQKGYQAALPRYADNPSPEYPRVARLRGWEGAVLFEVSVLKDGRIGDLKLVTSSGYRSLDNAARKTLKRWKFNPATVFGLPVESQVQVPIIFSLRRP